MNLKKIRSILITGGTGSFGQHFAKTALKIFSNLERLVIFSRDELKQFEMLEAFKKDPISREFLDHDKIRFFLGDIRDKERLISALDGIEVVIHAAALKQVPAAEYNPFEFINTNIIGAQNIITTCLQTNVKSVIALSTDKAAAPINLYGATKLCSDKLFVAANNFRGDRDIKFSVVRYGNVMGSRGSVIPLFLDQARTGTLTITDDRMTRFNIRLEEGVDMVIECLKSSVGGEIFVPRLPSYRILDLAEAVAPQCNIKTIGLRPGEKIHEEMITSSDSFHTFEGKKYFVITTPSGELQKFYSKNNGFKKVKDGFYYNSGENEKFLTVKEIRELLRQV